MKIVLVHNPASGSEKHTDRKLLKLLRRAGHAVVRAVDDPKKLPAILLEEPCDVVLVAGGDGTVGRTACTIADYGVPLAILPLGTANNTAATLGIELELEAAIGRLSSARRVPFDVALLDDGNVRQRFCEAAGWGVFVSTMLAAKQRRQKRRMKAQLERDRELLRSVLSQAAAREYRVEVDGRDFSGAYLMVEVLNVPLLGPKLRVSPHSEPSDGWLEVLLVRDSERQALLDLAYGVPDAPVALPFQRGRTVRIGAAEGTLHRDGSLWHHPEGAREFAIHVQARGVQYLC
jgi:diacylglycerol kinase family enzyme